MKNAIALLLVAGLCGAASAQSVLPGYEGPSYVINLDGSVAGGESTSAVNENYDNWRAAAQSGASNLTGLFVTGNHEIADDLNMINVGAGLLDSCGFAVANANGATGSVFTGGAGTIRFYRQSDGGYINGFNFNLPALTLAPGASSRISFAAGSLTSLNVFLPSSIYASLQITSVTGTGGFTIANAGHQLRAPINTGTSTDVLYDVTAGGGGFNFGGNPLANSAWFIKTDNVPAPGSIALLGIGGLVATRRRR